MRVLVIGHTYCEWHSRAKWRALMHSYPVTIKIVTPYYWPDVLTTVKSSPEEFYKEKRLFLVSPQHAYCLGNEAHQWYPSIFRIMKEFKPDIIQVETGSISLSLLQVLFFRLFLQKKPKVLFFSWINWDQKFGWRTRHFYRWLEWFNICNIDGAILGNQAAKDIYNNIKGLRSKTTVLPQLGTDQVSFSAATDKQSAKRNLGLNDKHIIIGFAARLVPEKGIDYLLNAYASLLKETKNAADNLTVVIAGTGPYQKNVIELIQMLGIESNVILLGALSHNKMPSLFKALDVFVLPSYDTTGWKEQFGQVLVQAMMTHVTVIGSDAGEIPYVISDAGLICKQKDVQSLKDCLKVLIEDSEQRKFFADKGHKRALSQYSPEVIARKTYEFWQEVLA